MEDELHINTEKVFGLFGNEVLYRIIKTLYEMKYANASKIAKTSGCSHCYGDKVS